MERLPHLSRRELLVSGAALGLAACGGPARGRDPLKSIQQGLAAAPLPAPWVPMVVRGTAIEVAGHRYRFDAGPFPTSLEVNGPEFLFDAINLDIRVQDELLVWQRARTISVDAAEVELLARGNAGDLIAQTRVTISYDGTCRFRVSLIPQGIVTIDSILLDVPILRGETTHYAHHLLGAAALTYSSLEFGRLIEGRQAIWGGGRIPDNGWSGEITPLFWVGNPDQGLVWFTEQLADQQRQAPETQIQLAAGGGCHAPPGGLHHRAARHAGHGSSRLWPAADSGTAAGESEERDQACPRRVVAGRQPHGDAISHAHEPAIRAARLSPCVIKAPRQSSWRMAGRTCRGFRTSRARSMKARFTTW